MTQQTSGVDFKRAEYKEAASRWRLVNDCYEGDTAIKDDKVAKTYLPYYGPSQKQRGVNVQVESVEASNPNVGDDPAIRYANFLLRAVFYNFVKRTVDGMKGLGFSGGTEYEAPDRMAYLEDNVNGRGISLDQSAKATTEEVIKTARGGLLTDYPVANRPATQAEADKNNIRARVLRYDASRIINWGHETFGAKTLLSLVVLVEMDQVRKDDGFEMETVVRYRVLRLDDAGLYTVEIYDDKERIEGPYEPKDSAGKRLDFIPFTFVGAQDNDADVDTSPVYDIASLNIGHYRNSADYENSAWIIGQPIPVISGLTQTWVDKNFAGGLQIGSGAAVPLPVDGAMEIVQVQPNSQAFEAMGYKEKIMAAIGAKTIRTDDTQKTAKEAGINNTNETSTLFDIMQNVETAYNRALEWCALFNGDDPDAVVYAINYEAVLATINADAARIIVESWQAGLIGKKDARDALRTAKYLDRTDEDIDNDLESELAGGLELDDGDTGTGE